MAPSPLHIIGEFLKERARQMAVTAPKEAPYLLIFVLVLGIALLLVLAWSIKVGGFS